MPRVLILTSNDNVVSHGVARLLRRLPSYELVQRQINNVFLLPKMINELCPSLIFVDRGLFVENAAFFFEAMHAQPTVKVIVLSDHENLIRVYEQTTVPIRTGDDLINQVISNDHQDIDLLKA